MPLEDRSHYYSLRTYIDSNSNSNSSNKAYDVVLNSQTIIIIFSSFVSTIMPRNSGGRANKEEEQRRDPFRVYNKLKFAHKFACFNFWIYIESVGSQGWNPDQNPGGIDTWRSSEQLCSEITERSWNRIGKVRHPCIAT